MFKFERKELDDGRQALEKHGVVSFLPSPPEWDIIRRGAQELQTGG